jgi:diguanylate cyclase (GGDEF)-like protein
VAIQLATRQERAIATRSPASGTAADWTTSLDDRGAARTPHRRDLDRFALNDTLGHAAGDAALVHFARILLEQIRGGDVAARVGGEEFLVWLPGTPLEEGTKVAERIRRRLGTMPWDWQGRSWPLSSSFGVAACPETSASRENLAGQADAALYEAKRGGRDRVEVWRRKMGHAP